MKHSVNPLWAVLLILMSVSVVNASNANVSEGWFIISPLIARASVESGVDVKLLTAMAAIESSFKPDAKNKNSTAKGIYQFTKRTWRVTLNAYGHLYGLDASADIHDPYANSVMAAEYIKENVHVMFKKLGRLPTYDEIYMAHLVSPLRAVAIAKMSDERLVAAHYPRLARVNKRLFYDEEGNALNARQFKALITAKVNTALHIYGGLANVALVKYQDGQIALAKLADTNTAYDFETCVREKDNTNPPVEIHFISYETSEKVKRCPSNSPLANALSLLYIPNREYDRY